MFCDKSTKLSVEYWSKIYWDMVPCQNHNLSACLEPSKLLYWKISSWSGSHTNATKLLYFVCTLWVYLNSLLITYCISKASWTQSSAFINLISMIAFWTHNHSLLSYISSVNILTLVWLLNTFSFVLYLSDFCMW